ncbi:lytic polysaccharide monooxygenase [Conexibacter stalactiti]|uniref:Lytic polysaccharide monooxygenase n=1 Tax=Conexibacter stalactiti TaxID=1940611 RepID=A0ABU4HRN5_9ACTN|nr:lytic polysaccharide monooxygenase [Conexibacter stalactiti]MDW5595409.1 lytic polysaccharide monooxygenase [Conexibacter stalactiti]MEC5036051.1 lytic polysaccharide monooxygenase [Conexibacter stalactiti]
MVARILCTAVVLLALGAAQAAAHGTTFSPASRTYVCRYVDRTPAPCANAWRSNPQALYDWMALLISNANGRHRELIPDGQLCSAGSAKYAAFDRPSAQWPATGLRAGEQTFKYVLNAPHATLYYRFYLTKDGFDPARALRWDDLELIHDSGRRPAATMESFRVNVPERRGRHILYVVWQRSDSPEAFYACSDVVFGAAGVLPATPPMPDESAPPAAGGGGGGHTGHGGHGGGRGGAPQPAKLTAKGISLRRTIDDDWGSGYCATVTVTNRSKRARAWKGTLAMPHRVDSIWDAVSHLRGKRLHVRGKSYNRTLRPGGATTFGFCARR